MAFMSKEEIPLRKLFIEAPNSLLRMSLQGKNSPHRHGFGYTWKSEAGRMERRRYGQEDLARTPDSFPNQLQVITTLAIGHVRKASPMYRGRTTAREAHPFIAEGIVLAHNGTIHDAEHLDSGPGIDSQRLARWLARVWHPRTSEGLVHSFGELLRTVRDFTAINFLLTEGAHLYAFCCYTRNPDYYTLWYRANAGEVVVASEPVDRASNWQPLRNGELLLVRPDLQVEIRNISVDVPA